MLYFLILSLRKRPAQVAEVLHFVLHNLELAFLLQAVIERRPEGLECQRAFVLQHRVGQSLLLTFKLGGIGLRFLANAVDEPIRPDVLDRRYVSLFHLERFGELFSAADARDRAAARQKFARFGFETERLGCGVEFFAATDTPPEFFSLGLC